jgi:hypothetical protein
MLALVNTPSGEALVEVRAASDGSGPPKGSRVVGFVGDSGRRADETSGSAGRERGVLRSGGAARGGADGAAPLYLCLAPGSCLIVGRDDVAQALPGSPHAVAVLGAICPGARP